MSDQLHAHALDIALDDCLSKISSGEWDLKACLEAYPQFADELPALLETAQAVRSLKGVGPSASFRAASHARLMARLESSQRPPNPPESDKSFKLPPRALGLVLAVGVSALLALNTLLGTPARSEPNGNLKMNVFGVIAGNHAPIIPIPQFKWTYTTENQEVHNDRVLSVETLTVLGFEPPAWLYWVAGDSDETGPSLVTDTQNLTPEAASQESPSALASTSGEPTGGEPAGGEVPTSGAAENVPATEAAGCESSGGSAVQNATLSEELGIPISQIEEWRCDGYGYGEITMAVSSARAQGVDPDTLLTGKPATGGMGQHASNGASGTNNAGGNSGSNTPPTNSNAGGNSASNTPPSNSNAGGNSASNTPPSNSNAGGNGGGSEPSQPENSNAGGNGGGNESPPPDNSNSGGNGGGNEPSPPENSNAGGNGGGSGK